MLGPNNSFVRSSPGHATPGNFKKNHASSHARASAGAGSAGRRSSARDSWSSPARRGRSVAVRACQTLAHFPSSNRPMMGRDISPRKASAGIWSSIVGCFGDHVGRPLAPGEGGDFPEEVAGGHRGQSTGSLHPAPPIRPPPVLQNEEGIIARLAMTQDGGPRWGLAYLRGDEGLPVCSRQSGEDGQVPGQLVEDPLTSPDCARLSPAEAGAARSRLMARRHSLAGWPSPGSAMASPPAASIRAALMSTINRMSITSARPAAAIPSRSTTSRVDEESAGDAPPQFPRRVALNGQVDGQSKPGRWKTRRMSPG